MSSFEIEEFENDNTKDEQTESPPNYHTLLAIITFILLPPFLFLTIPALIFSSEAKKLYNSGYTDLSLKFSEKSKRFSLSSWLVSVSVFLSVLFLYLFIIY